MNPIALRSLPSRLFATAILAASAFLLASCGGGGAAPATNPAPGSDLQILPATAAFYAGIPYTIQIAGGRRPYLLSSSDQTVLTVPTSLNDSSFQVIPSNPGVIDPNLPPGSVPRRTVTITVRDQDSRTVTAEIGVLQNFLTGYGAFFQSNCATSGAVAPSACAGGETILTVTPITNGLLYGNRLVRFEVVRGDFQFVIPETPSNPTATLSNTYTTNTDHTGTAIARLRVTGTARGQLATVRIIDVATGVYTDTVFAITPTAATGVLSIVPSAITFTGVNNLRCGTGSADILVFGGTAPYTAVSTNGAVAVTPSSSSTTPGRFTVTALNQSICGTFTVVVTDASGSRSEIAVTTALGTATVPAVAVSPGAITLTGCGQSGSVSVIGGNGNLVANSSSPTVGASIGGNTLTVTRIAGPSMPSVAAGTQITTVSVTDGATSSVLTVTSAATCS